MGKEQVKILPLDILDMSGGLNSNPLSTKITDNEFIDAKNVVWKDEAIGKIPGFSLHSFQIDGSGSTKRVTGIYDFQKRDGVKYLIAVTEDDLLNFTSSPTTSIKGALTFSNALQQFSVFNDRLIGTNYTDDIWTWNSVGNAVTLASLCGANLPPAKAKYVATFNSRVCFGNYIDNVGAYRPTAVAFCALDNSLFYDLTNQTWEFETDDSQQITGMRQLKDKFVVYKNNSIGIVTGAGTQSWNVQRAFVKGVGCVSGYTLTTGFLPFDGSLLEVHIFLSQDGFKAFDGTNVYDLPISKTNEDYKCGEYFDSLNKLYFSNAVGEFYRKRNWFFCFYANGGSITNDVGAIYNYRSNSLWPLEGFDVSCTSTVYNNSTKEYDLLIGTNDGRILKLSESDHSIDGSVELVTDGNMEVVGVADWDDVGTPATKAKDATHVLNGAQALNVITDAVGEGVSQTVTTEIGKRYRGYVWCYVTVGECLFEVKSSAGVVLVVTTTSAAASFIRLEVEFTATTVATDLIIRNDTTAASTFWIDDLTFRNCDIDAYAVTKDFDFGSEQDMKFLREIVPYAKEEGNYNVQFTIYFDRNLSVSTDNLNLLTGLGVWGGFLWGAIAWSGGGDINNDLENITQDVFRTMRIKFANPYGGQDFNINKILISASMIGRRWFHNS